MQFYVFFIKRSDFTCTTPQWIKSLTVSEGIGELFNLLIPRAPLFSKSASGSTASASLSSSSPFTFGKSFPWRFLLGLIQEPAPSLWYVCSVFVSDRFP